MEAFEEFVWIRHFLTIRGKRPNDLKSRFNDDTGEVPIDFWIRREKALPKFLRPLQTGEFGAGNNSSRLAFL